MNQQKLDDILQQHKLWLHSNRKEGGRADLSSADLRSAHLRSAHLRGANLSGANLQDADLRDADLRDANLRDANLFGADLFGADLRGANLFGADLRGARHAEYARMDESQKKYFNLGNNLQQQARENVTQQNRIKELEEKLKQTKQTEKNKEEIEQEKEEIKQELEKLQNIQAENKQIKEELERLQDKSLEGVIDKISASTKTSQKLLTIYKWQSIALLSVGVIFYLAAIFVGYKIYDSLDTTIAVKNWYVFAPTVLLGFIATALLRHDWKIRQLSQDLITHQNTTETATGILRASLDLQEIDGMPDNVLKESFDDMRSALLFGNKKPKESSITDEENLEKMVTSIVSKVVKSK